MPGRRKTYLKNGRTLKRRNAIAGERFTFATGSVIYTVLPQCLGLEGHFVCIACGIPLFSEQELEEHVAKPRPFKLRITNPISIEAAHHVIAWKAFATKKVHVP
jgi:hypothetical protein